VVLAGGEEVRAPLVVSAVHPKLTFLEQVDRAELPDFTADPGSHPQEHHTGAIELALSPQYVEQAFQDAKAGRGAACPFSDGCISASSTPPSAPRAPR
jgi:hypothetical protein